MSVLVPAPLQRADSEVICGNAGFLPPRCSSEILKPSDMFLDLMMLKPLERNNERETGSPNRKQKPQSKTGSAVMPAGIGGGSGAVVSMSVSEQLQRLTPAPSYMPGFMNSSCQHGSCAPQPQSPSAVAGFGLAVPQVQQPFSSAGGFPEYCFPDYRTMQHSGMVMPIDMQARAVPASPSLSASARALRHAPQSISFCSAPQASPLALSPKSPGFGGSAPGRMPTSPLDRPRVMMSAHGNLNPQIGEASHHGSPVKRMPQILENYTSLARGPEVDAWADDIVVPSEGKQHVRREPSKSRDDSADEDSEDSGSEPEWPLGFSQRKKAYCCF